MRNTLFATVSLIALLAVVAPYQAAHAADQKQKKEDVFIDEGDGDFDSMPVPTSTSSLKPTAEPSMHEAAAPQPVDVPEAAPVKEAAPETAQNAAPKEVPPAAALPEVSAQDDEAPAQAAAPAPAAPVAAPEAPAAVADQADEAPAKPEHHEKHAAKTAEHKAKAEHHDKHVASGKLAKGFYAVTQSACPMTRKPASDSEMMITVKPSKKIWVEKVDANWVRAFNKAGEPGYISQSCVELQ